nr:MAG TPA: hypothetical protein [Caudoviricetes sp.]
MRVEGRVWSTQTASSGKPHRGRCRNQCWRYASP